MPNALFYLMNTTNIPAGVLNTHISHDNAVFVVSFAACSPFDVFWTRFYGIMSRIALIDNTVHIIFYLDFHSIGYTLKIHL